MTEPRDVTVTVVEFATRTTSRSQVFMDYDQYGEPDGPIDMSYFVWLVQGCGLNILVDTGMTVEVAERRGRTMLRDLVSVLSELGAGPADAPDIVITHLHYDHSGNVARYPGSNIWMARAELDFWLSDRPSSEERALAEERDLDLFRSGSLRGRLHLFEESAALGDGVRVIRLGGHTPGQSVVEVVTESTQVLIASDSIHYVEEAQLDRPFAHMTDLAESAAAYDWIRAWQRSRPEGVVLTGHDPVTSAVARAAGFATVS